MGKKGKGKQPTGGRAKARVKAEKHSSGSGGYEGGYGRAQRHFLDDADDNGGKMFRGFAQGSPRGDSSPRNANVKLRHQAISFVSAGSNAPIVLESSKLAEKVAVGLDDDDAGSSEDEVDFEGEFDKDEDMDDSTIQTNIVGEQEVERSESAIGRMKIESPPSPSPLEFVIDMAGDPTLAAKLSTDGRKTNGKARAARSPSPALSDASDDVVLFHGRSSMPVRTVTDDIVQKPAAVAKAPAPAIVTAVSAPQPLHAPAPDRTPHITDDLLAALRGSPGPSASPSPAKGWATQASKHEREAAAASSDIWRSAPAKPYWKNKKGLQRPDLDPQVEDLAIQGAAPSRPPEVTFQEVEEHRGAEATIAKLQADWKNTLKEKKRANAMPEYDGVDELELDLGRKSNRRGKRGWKKSNRQMRNAITSDEEDNAEAAYDDYMQNLAAQLAAEDGGAAAATPATFMSEAVLGPSMVVDGKEVADDETVKHSNEDEWEDEDSDSSDTNKVIGEDASDLSDVDSSELEEELEYTEREQLEDEQDLRQRRQDAMTDEQIARLFAKQQELGINSEDLIIDDGIYEEEDDAMEGVGDLVAAKTALQDISNFSTPNRTTNRSKRAPKRARKGQGDFSFPDASALADTLDQYGAQGFDIMDLERPSLRPTKKGRKSQGALPPELEALSDDELRECMLGAWENDREKKRMKKAEREELRQQGLLGLSGKRGKADLGMKYLQGMTMKQVQEELKIFLQDDGQKSRPFPPMDKKDRKTLHEVAGALNLKSKSVGSGNQRFPVLYKTSWTADYSEFHFEKIMVSAQRGFLKNSAGKGKKGARGSAGPGGGSGRKMGAGRGGGFDKAAVSLRNGEVVGANAAELGKENFGHKLMEKMGWSAGMALGKEGEGMKVPVAQVMRTGRAGLG